MSHLVEITGPLTVRELAERLEESPIKVIKALMAMGVMANINQTLDYDTAVIAAVELGHEVVVQGEPEPVAEVVEAVPAAVPPSARKALYAAEPKEKLKVRPPVVTILGHVDHGKTTLLDAIRESNVVAGEAGGITQHIGAYQVTKQGRLITFIDTPGHQAFTAMRARGAQGADIAVLVVAADDGVMPQTLEAYDHIKAANVPIIVALNKIDKANANPDRVKQQLAEINLVPEEWGGETPVVEMSALRGEGVDDLLDVILLVADLNEGEIIANSDRPAQGVVIESVLEEKRGPMATLLVQNGTLKIGDSLVVGTVAGRVRAMFDENGRRVKEAPPSKPVQLMGLSDVVTAGERFAVVKNDREAREIAAERAQQAHQHGRARITLEDVYRRLQTADRKELNIILKVDVQGSLEPIINELSRLNTDETSIKVLRSGIGQITESDVSLAAASEAVIIGFNVEPDRVARDVAEQEGVQLRTYTVIYKLIEDMEMALKGMLEPTYEPVTSGRAEVRQVFQIGKRGNVAGCAVIEGTIYRNAQARVYRGREVIYDGAIDTLRRFTEDVREVRTGFECGIALEGFDDFEVGDIIESYRMERVAVV
ncbi:MAG TPA: translation initiation factor IF-2 [Chloroflexi bacterium]|nr:translation initiation factor IF-2 [Chloroflexota bacterium]